jgi:hypothetical protein
VASSTLHTRSLFSARERTDDRPRAHGEPSYAFLDRAAGARWQRVRETLDAWYARLPEPARRDLRNRFALTTELDHLGAFWELWVHEAHRRLGFDVTVHVGTDAGERRQDFLVARAGAERFWLEATVVGGDSPLSFTERKLDEALCDLIETVQAPRFSLGLEVVRYGACTPGRRRVVPRIERWLRELDPDALRARQAAGAPAPTRSIEFDGWRIELEAIADAGEAESGARRRLLARRAAACSAGAVNDIRPLRRKIKKKAARYGQPDRPYLLAVLALGEHVGERDVEHALLGIPGRPQDHAVWHGPAGPCNTRLSGVLVARGLQPARRPAAPPRLWHNPWAVHSLAVELPWRVARREARSEAALDAVTSPPRGARPTRDRHRGEVALAAR